MNPEKLCSMVGFDFVIRVRQKNWDTSLERYAEAAAWLRSNGGTHDTVEKGYLPRDGAAAMWWPEWKAGYAVYCFAFADPYLATEFLFRFD